MRADRNRNLDGRVALVTGGASGIGLAIAERFVERGARVVVLDIGPDAARTLADKPGITLIACDITDPEAVAAAFSRAEAEVGPLDIVVANAGISQNSPTLDLAFAQWRKVMAINLDGVFLTAQEAGRRMVPRGHGVILMMASMYGVVAAPERIAYVASKSAVAAMAKALAIEWGPYGVRVNGMAPGYVRTPLVADLIARGRLDAAKLEAKTPLRRMIDPAEIADLAAFMASDEAGGMTGHIAVFDGGFTANGYL
jgi:NAD(P)-dependent dehydrogenase (short-subunit alcohol dehydrogenase family)